MSHALDRGQLLLEQNRVEEALRETMQHLALEPESVEGHMLAALCFSELDRDDDALQHAETCVALAPDLPTVHIVLGRIQIGRKKYRLARDAAHAAIALDPDEEDAWAVVAASHVGQSEWKDALTAAKKGLEVDPTHEMCRNFCVIALTQLGRKDEARQVAYGALAQDPESPVTHASTGWAHLHGGKAKDALPHFKESLRLDPGNEWARAGFVEAMKGKNVVYAAFLRYFLWLGSFKPQVQFGLIVGAVIFVNVVAHVGRTYPDFKSTAEFIQALYILFIISVWVASPLFDALLLFNRDGRHALNPRQKATSATLLLTLAFCTVCAGALATQVGLDFWTLVIPYFILFPVMMTCKSRVGWPLAFSIVYTLVVLGFFLAPFVGITGKINYYILGCVIATWIGGFLIPSE